MLDYLCIIQARATSTRLPGKVFMTVGGISMVKRVWTAATATGHKVVVAWPERYPNLDESDVLERFKMVSDEFPSRKIIRLTSDCPLLTCEDILEAIKESEKQCSSYYSNHKDGHDVQIFVPQMLYTSAAHREHVIADFNTKSTGLSVNTHEDLERVRKLCKTK